MSLMTAQDQRTQLSSLVRSRRAEIGGGRPLSLRDLAERCIDPETGERPFGFAWLSKLERGLDVLTPKPPGLRALAVGLQLPLRVVKSAAAAQFMGIEGDAVWTDDGSVRAVVAHMEGLSEEGRRELAEIAEVIARRWRGGT